jgi:hypothetical protein
MHIRVSYSSVYQTKSDQSQCLLSPLIPPVKVPLMPNHRTRTTSEFR